MYLSFVHSFIHHSVLLGLNEEAKWQLAIVVYILTFQHEIYPVRVFETPITYSYLINIYLNDTSWFLTFPFTSLHKRGSQNSSWYLGKWNIVISTTLYHFFSLLLSWVYASSLRHRNNISYPITSVTLHSHIHSTTIRQACIPWKNTISFWSSSWRECWNHHFFFDSLSFSQFPFLLTPLHLHTIEINICCQRCKNIWEYYSHQYVRYIGEWNKSVFSLFKFLRKKSLNSLEDNLPSHFEYFSVKIPLWSCSQNLKIMYANIHSFLFQSSL